MYNEKVKSKFLETINSEETAKSVIRLFNALEPYEKELDADFCTWTEEEVKPVINKIVGIRSFSQKFRISLLKNYVEWCLKNNIDGAREINFSVNDIGLEKLKSKTVANPQHLQMYLDCLCDDPSEETIDCVYRSFYWLAYSGMLNDEDALNVLKEDLDFENMIINFGGYEYPIYREAVQSFRKCVELRRFKYKHSNYNNDVYKQRASSNKLLSGFSDYKSIKVLRAEMSKRKKESKYADSVLPGMQLQLSYRDVWLSGVFFRYSQSEKIGMIVDFTPVSKYYLEMKSREPDFKGWGMPLNRRISQMNVGYKKDYMRWKEAYSI